MRAPPGAALTLDTLKTLELPARWKTSLRIAESVSAVSWRKAPPCWTDTRRGPRPRGRAFRVTDLITRRWSTTVGPRRRLDASPALSCFFHRPVVCIEVHRALRSTSPPRRPSHTSPSHTSPSQWHHPASPTEHTCGRVVAPSPTFIGHVYWSWTCTAASLDTAKCATYAPPAGPSIAWGFPMRQSKGNICIVGSRRARPCQQRALRRK